MNRKAMRMVAACAFVGAFASGCVGMALGAAGFKPATDAELKEPVAPSFQVGETRKPGDVRGQDKLVGKWTASLVADTKIALMKYKRVNVQTATSTQTYFFYGDGACRTLIVMGGKETTWNGRYTYADGILTITGPGGDGKEHSFSLKLLWYSDTEFEMRHADVATYEDMMRQAPNVKEVNCSYELDGAFRTRFLMMADGMETVMTMIESPKIFDRDGDVD